MSVRSTTYQHLTLKHFSVIFDNEYFTLPCTHTTNECLFNQKPTAGGANYIMTDARILFVSMHDSTQREAFELIESRGFIFLVCKMNLSLYYCHDMKIFTAAEIHLQELISPWQR